MITCSIRQGDWWRSAHAPQRYVHMGFAFFQCFLGAGIIFGWSAILPVLERERIYNEECVEGEHLCKAQSDMLQRSFTIAGSCSMLSNLLLGIMFDKFGPRVTKGASLLMLMAGATLVGHAHYRSDPSEYDLMLPGMALIGFAGPGVQLSNIHISSLFPEARALVTCFIVGALQMSFFIFTIFAFLYDHYGLTKLTIFQGYTYVLFATLVGCLIMDPDTPFQPIEIDDTKAPTPIQHELLSPIRLPSVFREEETSLLMSTPEISKYRTRRASSLGGRRIARAESVVFMTGDLQNRSFKTQVLSIAFILLTLYFSVCALWCNFFLGSVTAQLRERGELSSSQVSSLIGDLGVILPSSVVFIPLVGYLLESWGYMGVTVLCTATALLFTALFQSSSTYLLVASFVLYTFFRTILFSLLFASLGQTFGFQHFGVLSGITFVVAALIGLLQTPLTEIGDFAVVSYIQFGSLLLTLVLPLYELRRDKRL